MFFADRLKKTIYVAHMDDSTRPVTYKLESTPYRVNCLPTTADADVKAYGIGYSHRLRVTCDKTYASRIKEFDLVYVDSMPGIVYDESGEVVEDVFAADADYVVESKLDGLNGTTIVLARRAGASNG